MTLMMANIHARIILASERLRRGELVLGFYFRFPLDAMHEVQGYDQVSRMLDRGQRADRPPTLIVVSQSLGQDHLEKFYESFAPYPLVGYDSSLVAAHWFAERDQPYIDAGRPGESVQELLDHYTLVMHPDDGLVAAVTALNRQIERAPEVTRRRARNDYEHLTEVNLDTLRTISLMIVTEGR